MSALEQSTLFPVPPAPEPLTREQESTLIWHDAERGIAWVVCVEHHTDTPDRAKAVLIERWPDLWGYALDPANVFVASTTPPWCRINGVDDDSGMESCQLQVLTVADPAKDLRCFEFDISDAGLSPESESEHEWRTGNQMTVEGEEA